jgi:hypothetical protein
LCRHEAEAARRPVMKWDAGEEHLMKERLAFNPRAMGKVGRAPTVVEEISEYD